MRTWQIEWGKLALILVLAIMGFVLIIIALVGDIADDRFAITLSLGSSILASVSGYLFGNGRLATKGEPNVPTLGRSDPFAAVRAELEALRAAISSDADTSNPALPRLTDVTNVRNLSPPH